MHDVMAPRRTCGFHEGQPSVAAHVHLQARVLHCEPAWVKTTSRLQLLQIRFQFPPPASPVTETVLVWTPRGRRGPLVSPAPSAHLQQLRAVPIAVLQAPTIVRCTHVEIRTPAFNPAGFRVFTILGLRIRVSQHNALASAPRLILASHWHSRPRAPSCNAAIMDGSRDASTKGAASSAPVGARASPLEDEGADSAVPPVISLAVLERILDLEDIEVAAPRTAEGRPSPAGLLDIFRGTNLREGTFIPRTFGGQLVGQALVAASRTVAPQFVVHSLHSYFLLPGDAYTPYIYTVERLRDGHSFATRRVVARQKGEALFQMQVSFQVRAPTPPPLTLS
jgi:hypothetical protein